MACPAGVCSTSYPSLLKTSITVLLPMKWPAVKRKMTWRLSEHKQRKRSTTKSFLLTGGVPHSEHTVLLSFTISMHPNTGSLMNDCWAFPRSFQLPQSAFLWCRCDWNYSGLPGCCINRPLWISWGNKSWSQEISVQEQHQIFKEQQWNTGQNLTAMCTSF